VHPGTTRQDCRARSQGTEHPLTLVKWSAQEAQEETHAPVEEVMERATTPVPEEVVPEVVVRAAAPAPAPAPAAVAPAPAGKSAAPVGKPEWKQAVRHPSN